MKQFLKTTVGFLYGMLFISVTEKTIASDDKTRRNSLIQSNYNQLFEKILASIKPDSLSIVSFYYDFMIFISISFNLKIPSFSATPISIYKIQL